VGNDVEDRVRDEKSIFAEALGMTSPHERGAFLDHACTDPGSRQAVEALLRAHERGEGILDCPPAGLTALGTDLGMTDSSVGPREQLGTIIGPYKLMEQIGEGAMGVVYVAEQLRPVHRRVALKIVKPGLDTKQVIARFEAERQALALMDHPCIAKVFDAGVTETGRSYFVMELVRGVPLTEYCDQNQLPPRARLELFMQVCSAVQHAHTKGIIHRDLKPSNVLVTLNEDASAPLGAGKPTPKIIDFGIAKATAGQRLTERTLYTEFRLLIGTPLYMSPEQAEMSAVMDVDTRSDVYSLGVLLYELLTGTTPFDKHRLATAAFDEVRRIIREEEPPRPSTRLSTLGATLTTISLQRQTEPKKLGTIVRGELDWIVMKALEKDRTRRYETANGLAKDIERYLSDQPVDACPPTRIYRLRKFARRNKAALLTGSIIAAVLLVATVVSTWQAVRATRAERLVVRQRDQLAVEKERADGEAAQAQAVHDFVMTMLASPDPDELLGDKVTVLQATQQGIKRLDDGVLKEQPKIEAAVRYAIGKTLLALGRYDEAEPQLRKSLELRRQKSGTAGDKAVAVSLTVVASVLRARGQLADAEPLLREALEISRRLVPTDRPEIARNLTNLGLNLQEEGKLAEAEPLLRESLAIARTVDPAGLAPHLNNLGLLLLAQGKLAEAEPVLREAVALMPQGHPNTAIVLNNLAGVLKAREKLAEAEPLYREALEIHRKAFPAGHPRVAMALNNYALVLQLQGHLDEAEPLFREALEIRRKALPADHPETAISLNNLGMLLRDQRKFAEAEPLLREALESKRRKLTATDPGVADGLRELGLLLCDERKFAEAERLFREALQIRRKALPADHSDIRVSLRDLGVALEGQEKLDEALPVFEDLYSLASQAKQEPKLAAQQMEFYGLCLGKLGKFGDAETPLRTAYQRLKSTGQEKHKCMRAVLTALAEVCDANGRSEEAGKLRDELAAITPTNQPAVGDSPAAASPP
jgi:serine/threonine protein kinase/tetratricopeptide (TPR) repeat protein